MLLTGLVVSIILGFCGKSMAANKNRSEVAGFLLCFFLGIIGIIIVLCMGEGMQPYEDKGDSIFKDNNNNFNGF